MTSDNPTTEKLPTAAPHEATHSPETTSTAEQPGRPPKPARFDAVRRQVRAAPVLAGILAAVVIGGLGFGAGYLVGGSGHEHGRGGHSIERNGFGPGGPGFERPDRMPNPTTQPSTGSPAPTAATPGA